VLLIFWYFFCEKKHLTSIGAFDFLVLLLRKEAPCFLQALLIFWRFFCEKKHLASIGAFDFLVLLLRKEASCFLQALLIFGSSRGWYKVYNTVRVC